MLGHCNTPLSHSDTCGACVGTSGALGFGALRCGSRVVGVQAFAGAFAFNADIGSWNTVSVSTLYYVCAL